MLWHRRRVHKTTLSHALPNHQMQNHNVRISLFVYLVLPLSACPVKQGLFECWKTQKQVGDPGFRKRTGLLTPFQKALSSPVTSATAWQLVLVLCGHVQMVPTQCCTPQHMMFASHAFQNMLVRSASGSPQDEIVWTPSLVILNVMMAAAKHVLSQ